MTGGEDVRARTGRGGEAIAKSHADVKLVEAGAAIDAVVALRPRNCVISVEGTDDVVIIGPDEKLANIGANYVRHASPPLTNLLNDGVLPEAGRQIFPSIVKNYG